MITCEICGLPVETDGDINAMGRNITVAIDGKSVHCEGCCAFVHVGCASADGEYCVACVGLVPAGMPT